ncbi:XkdX family protein [Schleiferilactobacillus harbinensis]
MLDFVKTMYAWGCPIEGYVAAGAITAAEYKIITGEDYVAPVK